MRTPSLVRRPPLSAVLVLLGATLIPGLAAAQPLGAWLNVTGPTHGYIAVPTSPDLTPATALTLEAWVNVTDAHGGGCSSIVGKNYTQAWWVGICGTTLRSYVRGLGSAKNGGTIPAGQWTHIAVTFEGGVRKHYINGELISSFLDPGALTGSAAELRIGSDVSWQFTPSGSLDEVRLWSVARTIDQIRANINVTISPQAGLVGYWKLDASGLDASGNGHNGAVSGSGTSFSVGPAIISCGSSGSTVLCLNTVLAVSAKFRVGAPGTAETQAHVAVSSANSGIFYFFAANNWEVTVKTVDGCGVNPYYWVFVTSDTSLFYRLEVTDVLAGATKVYFNWPTLTPFSILDTQAFSKGCF